MTLHSHGRGEMLTGGTQLGTAGHAPSTADNQARHAIMLGGTPSSELEADLQRITLDEGHGTEVGEDNNILGDAVGSHRDTPEPGLLSTWDEATAVPSTSGSMGTSTGKPNTHTYSNLNPIEERGLEPDTRGNPPPPWMTP